MITPPEPPILQKLREPVLSKPEDKLDKSLLLDAAVILAVEKLNEVLDSAIAKKQKPNIDQLTPSYWHVVDEDGVSIYSASFKEACQDHINDCLLGDSVYAIEEASKWVVRPLYTQEDILKANVVQENEE